MPYIARVALHNGRIVSLREPGRPQTREFQQEDGSTVQFKISLPPVYESDSAEQLHELCASHGIHATIVEMQDAEIVESPNN